MQTQTVTTSASSINTPVAQPSRMPKQAKLVKSMSRVNLRSFVENQNGLFVSLDFLKVDGSKRTLTGRLGVTAPLKGGANKVEASDRPYLTMFDIQIRQYRTVSLDTVSELRANNTIYRIID